MQKVIYAGEVKLRAPSYGKEQSDRQEDKVGSVRRSLFVPPVLKCRRSTIQAAVAHTKRCEVGQTVCYNVDRSEQDASDDNQVTL